MNKVYTFKKDILFKNNIYEILSIALDKTFSVDGYTIRGEFNISGDYLIKESEQDTFNINIPYLNYIEDVYDVSNITVDIDDFYYDVKDDNRLCVNIDVLVDGLEEKENRDFIEEVEAKGELIEDDDDDDDDDLAFASLDNDRPNHYLDSDNTDAFVTYRVCIVREGDTLESITDKYAVSLDTLKEYNIINEINPGDKLIIPYERN